MVPLSVVVCFAVLAVSAATDVTQCKGRDIPNLKNDVVLTPCKKLPCKLKKGSDQHITINFKPDKVIDNLVNRVTADVFGVPLPFLGVDGMSVCDKIFNAEDGTKAECPLVAGTQYVYKDSFPVLAIYPSIPVKVHWSLKHGSDDLVCFEVPARIAS